MQLIRSVLLSSLGLLLLCHVPLQAENPAMEAMLKAAKKVGAQIKVTDFEKGYYQGAKIPAVYEDFAGYKTTVISYGDQELYVIHGTHKQLEAFKAKVWLFRNSPRFQRGERLMIAPLMEKMTEVELAFFSDGHPELFLAIREGNLKKVKKLAKGLNLNEISFSEHPDKPKLNEAFIHDVLGTMLYDLSPLQLALFHGHEKLVKYFMDQGLKLEETFSFISPMVPPLDVDHSASDASVLKLVSLNKKYELLGLLTEQKLDLNHKDSRGTPGFFYLANARDVAVMKQLVKHGADLSLRRDADQRTVLFDVSYKPSIEYLVKSGMDVNAKDAKGQTPIFSEKGKLNLETFRSLGADFNHQDDKGQTVIFQLDDARQFGYLKKHGVDLNHQDKKGNTILHDKILYDFLLEGFIEAGVDPSLKNKAGLTAAALAKKKGYKRSHAYLDSLMK